MSRRSADCTPARASANARAARAGSAAPRIALRTATPCAPAFSTDPTRSGVRPPIAKIGVGARIAAEPGDQGDTRARMAGLRSCREDRTGDDVRDALGAREHGLLLVVDAPAREREAWHRGRGGGRQVEPDAEGAGERGVAVDDEPRARAAQPVEEPPEQGLDCGFREIALPHLDEPHASRDRRLDDVHQVPPARREAVGHQHESGQRDQARLLAGVRQRSGSRSAWIRPAHGLDASA